MTKVRIDFPYLKGGHGSARQRSHLRASERLQDSHPRAEGLVGVRPRLCRGHTRIGPFGWSEGWARHRAGAGGYASGSTLTFASHV
jgi:hypothetical protein